MANVNKTDLEQKIEKAHNRRYKKDPGDAILENFDLSSRLHVEKILEIKPDSVLDVGMGAGGILLALQKNGVKNIYGVDLSSNAVEKTKKRFETFGTLENTYFTRINFLDYDIPKVDTISIHHTLNTYPDYEAMINKAIDAKPQIIAITKFQFKMKKSKELRIANFLVKMLVVRSFSFRAVHVHPTNKIEQMMSDANYEKVFSKEFKKSETIIFRLKP